MEQNKISRRNFLRVAGASATAAAMSGLVPAASAAGIKDLWSMDLQILATSDTHGKFDPWDYAANKADASGSVAQQATAIKENRTRTTLVVDAGDTIQANSAELFLNDDVHPMIAAQNAIGYDVYVTGNHEWASGQMPQLRQLLEETGVTYLSNTFVPLERNGDTITLAGIDDPNGYAGQKSPEEVAGEVKEAAGDGFWLLMAHRNNLFDGEYCRLGADLVLSGHGHGGIWRLPFTDGLVDTNLNLLPSFTSGFYHCTDEDCEGAEVFVSRGLGNSPKWAFRLFNRPQIAVVTLKKG